MNPLATFSNFFQGGGPFMYVILITGVTILALALERGVGHGGLVHCGRHRGGRNEAVPRYEMFSTSELPSLNGLGSTSKVSPRNSAMNRKAAGVPSVTSSLT